MLATDFADITDETKFTLINPASDRNTIVRFKSVLICEKSVAKIELGAELLL